MKPHVPFHEGVTVWGSLRNNLIVKDGFYMKFRKSILFLSIIGLMFLPSPAFALQWFEWTYTLDANNKATITGYTGTGGAIVIPAYHRSHSKTGGSHWGYCVCWYRQYYERYGQWNNLTSIGNYAFIDCTGLTSVTIPNSVTSIGV